MISSLLYTLMVSICSRKKVGQRVNGAKIYEYLVKWENWEIYDATWWVNSALFLLPCYLSTISVPFLLHPFRYPPHPLDTYPNDDMWLIVLFSQAGSQRPPQPNPMGRAFRIRV
jgi:hypothetical protein